MGTQEHLHVVQLLELLVGDGDQALVAQPLDLAGIVHNVAQAVEVAPLGQLLLGLVDGTGHAEAKSRV